MGRLAAARLIVGVARQRRPALLRGTALRAVTILVFAANATAQPAPTAQPTGGKIVAGSANIGQTTNATTVNQSSQRAAITWQNFDVGSRQTVQFNQPNASAVTLNSVSGPDPSQIAGRIVANGNIIITNPAGVAFSKGAEVNVNGLIVSAPGITTQHFMDGKLIFDQAPKPGAAVTNAGTITVKQAGLAALVAPQVANSGVINARLGHVVLAGAEAHTIDLYGDGLVSIDVTKAVTQIPVGAGGQKATALVTNTGTVIADGGSVQITARAADGIVQDLVRAGGTIRANSVGARTGRVEIAGVGGSVRVEGRVAADGKAGSSGGTVGISASDTVTVANGARITANGRAGGGTVALGTTMERARAGRQAALTNGVSPGTPAGTAQHVTVQRGATVSADGAGGGSGGTVTTLSTRSTQVDGLLTARGGARGGDGGEIEASSKGVLGLTRAPDAIAPAGKGGTIYLDPYDLVIGTGTPMATLGGSETDRTLADISASGTSYIAPATLQQAAQYGAVTISLYANHDLTVTEPIDVTVGRTSIGGASGGASLYLHADHDLNVLANITIGAAGSGRTLALDAGHDLLIGPVQLFADGTITMTTTGSFTGDAFGSSISVHDSAMISSNAAIVLQASNRVDVGANVQLTAGPHPGFSLGEEFFAGIDVAAGTAITVGTNSALAVTAPPSAQSVVQLASGGSIAIGDRSRLDAGGSLIYVYAGGSTGAPGIASGSVSIGAGASLGNARFIGVGTGSSGSLLLGAGSTLTATDPGSGPSAGFTNIGLAAGTGGISLGGTVSGGANSSLTMDAPGGMVTQASGGSIVTGDLSGKAASYDLAGTGNQIGAIGASSGETLSASAGNITVVDSAPLTISSGSGSPGGGIQVTSGQTIALVTDQLTINFGELPDPAGTGLLDFSLYAPGGTIAIKPFTTGRQVELVQGAKAANTLAIGQTDLTNIFTDTLQLGSSTAGTLTISGTVSLAALGQPSQPGGGSIRELDLSTGAAISQVAGSTLTVATLTANGASVDLTGGANQITTLAASSATSGNFSLENGTTPLELTNVLNASGQVSLTLDNLDFCSCASISAATLQLTPYTPGRQVELVADAPSAGSLSIAQSMINAISVQTLVLGGNALGGINIGNAHDLIDLTGHAAILDLVGPGSVTEGDGAALRVGTLEVSSLPGGTLTSSVTLNGPNQVGVLTATSSGDVAVTNAQTLAVDVASTSGNISITTTAGDIDVLRTSATLDGSVNGVSGAVISLDAAGNLLFEAGSHPENVVQATGSMVLKAGGDITQDAGAISTPALTGYAAGAALAQVGNQITTLSSFIVSGDLTLSDSVPLTVGGVVSVGSGRTLALAADTVAIGPDSALSAPGGVVAIAPVTSSDPLILSSAPTATVVADTLRVASTTTGDITLSGNFDLTSVATLDLRSAGNISQVVGSTIQVGTLTGQAYSVALTGANQIDRLSSFTVDGRYLPGETTSSFRLNNARSLVVTGNVAATAGDVVIDTSSSANADVTIAAPIYSFGGNWIVNSGHSITVSSGATITSSLGVDLEASYGQNDPAASGRLQINAALVPSNITLGAGPGGINIDATLSGLLTVTLRGEGNAVAALSDLYRGPITQTAGIITTSKLSASGTSVALNEGNLIGTIVASTATTGDFSVTSTTPVVSVNGLVSVSTGRSITIASPTLQFDGGSLTAPNGLIALIPSASSADFTLAGPLGAAAISSATLQIGSASAGSVSLAGALSFDRVGTLDLRSAGSISQTAGSALTVGTLTLEAGSANLLGSNQVATLGAFTLGGALALNDAGSLTIAGPGIAGSMTINAGGSVIQTGGDLTAATLSGSAVGTAQFGVGGTATISSLGAFAVAASVGTPSGSLSSPTSTFTLADAISLSVNGPIAAGSITVTAPRALRLVNGQISADTATIGVSSAGVGVATLTQTGTTVITPFSQAAGSLTISLPGNGTVALQQLDAPSMNLQLTLGTGTATGKLNVATLSVTGSGGGATLTGTVGGQGGGSAAAIASIAPSTNTAYTMNGCTVGAGVCGVAVGNAPGASVPAPPTAVQPPGTHPLGTQPTGTQPTGTPLATPPTDVTTTPSNNFDAFAELFTPKSFLDAELGNILKPDRFALDLITIGIFRNQGDAELLPNISDRDY